MITIDANPQAYRKAGLGMLDACVLALLVRAGLSGLTNKAMQESLRCSISTLEDAGARLVKLGMVARPQRKNKQGRPHVYHATPAGIALQAKAMLAVDYQLTAQLPLKLP